MSGASKVSDVISDIMQFTNDYVQLKQDVQEKLTLMQEIAALSQMVKKMKSIGAALPLLMNALEQKNEMEMLLTADGLKLNADLQTMSSKMQMLFNKGKDITVDEANDLAQYIQFFMNIQFFADDGSSDSGGLDPDLAKGIADAAENLLHNGLGLTGHVNPLTKYYLQSAMQYYYAVGEFPGGAPIDSTGASNNLGHINTIQSDMLTLSNLLGSFSKSTTIAMQFKRNSEKSFVGSWQNSLQALMSMIEKAVAEMSKGSGA